MKLEDKIKKAREVIKEAEREEAYPSTPEEIRKRNPNAVFYRAEKMRRVLKVALFYIQYNRRKAHRLLDKILEWKI